MTAKAQTSQPAPARPQQSSAENERLGLHEDEHIIHETGTHWIILFGRTIWPLMVMLFFGGLAFYRANGGTFLSTSARVAQGFDLLNWILMVFAGLMLLAWLVLWVRSPKDRQSRAVMLTIFVILAMVIYFRYEGWRLFSVDPFYASEQIFDGWNWFLYICAAISLVAVGISAYDWQNDRLILTNKRVIFDDDLVLIPRLLERRTQREVNIDDIQDVVATTRTYPQHWLGFGRIVVKSASYAGQIEYTAATNPRLMQSKIMAEVNAHRRQNTERDFERMIESSIYGNKAGKSAVTAKKSYSRAWQALRWVLPENPERNLDKGEVIWRPHWLFLVQALGSPLMIFAAGIVVLVLSVQFSWFTGPLIGVTLLVLLIGCALWLAWEIEDYRNDLYILTPNTIIDIQKKPFGPEDRRTARLEQIQNVSYRTTFIGNLLGYGNVLVETAGGGGQFTFTRVPDPRSVVAEINNYRRQFDAGKRERALNDTLSLIRHYHTAQVKHNEIGPGNGNSQP